MSVNLPVSLAQTGWLPSEPGHACCRCPMPSGEKCRWSHSAPSITKQLPSSTAATVQGATVSQLGRECVARLVSPRVDSSGTGRGVVVQHQPNAGQGFPRLTVRPLAPLGR